MVIIMNRIHATHLIIPVITLPDIVNTPSAKQDADNIWIREVDLKYTI